MSENIVIDVSVDSQMLDSDAIATYGWKSGSEEELSSIQP
jgi:hypothetical protein